MFATLARRLALVAFGSAVAASVLACVKIPDNVQQTFAPAQPQENSYFRKRSDAPGALGFITLDDLKVADAGTDAMPTEAGATPEMASDASVAPASNAPNAGAGTMSATTLASDGGTDGGAR